MQIDLGGLIDRATAAWNVTSRRGRHWKSTLAPLVILMFISAFGSPIAAQSYLTGTGSPSFAAPEPVELGFVDASNGNLHLNIQLGSYPQRGGQSQPITLEYDSSIWMPYNNGATLQWEPTNGAGSHTLAGWYFSYEASNVNNWINLNVVQGCWTDENWADQSGTDHVFHLNESGNNGCPSSADAFATDSSGFHMYFTSTGMTVYAPDGTLAYQAPAPQDPQGNYIQSKDTNGNYLSTPSSAIGGIIDTLGRQIASGTSSSGATLMTSQGTSSYSFSTTTINVTTNFQESGILENSTSVGVLRSVTLPDTAHSTYYFVYDCDESGGNAACGSPSGQSAYYGDLIGITLPTGGTVTYAYQNFSDAYGNKSQWVHTRLSAGGTWTYTPQVLSTCTPTQVNCQQKTTVSSPSPSNTTVYTFQLNNGAWPITIVRNNIYGTMVSTVTNTWDFSQSCVLNSCHGNSFVRLLNQQTTVPAPAGNLAKQVSYTYDSPQTGNQTAIKEWRYVPSGNSFPSVPDPGLPTYISYLTTGTNDINRPASVTLCNNSGSDSACPGGFPDHECHRLYTYDNYSSGLTTISGAAHHDDTNFGSGYTARGNVTEVSRWVSGSEDYMNFTFYTYDTTGQVPE